MLYTSFDRFVAWCRFRAALPHIRPQSLLCDVGCGVELGFLHYIHGRIRFGVGLDYQAATCVSDSSPVIKTDITRGFPLRSNSFDHVVLLAVFEHLAQPEAVLREVFRVLAPDGSLIMTWPSAVVDPVLNVLHRVGIVSDEMESHKHERRIPPDQLRAMLGGIGFERFTHRTFELRLNNLMVAYKPR